MTARRPLVRFGGRIRQLPSGDTLSGVREMLTAARTYYVRTDGSDSNTGLSNTAGGAFATIQRAMDVAGMLDTGIFNVTVQVAAGSYTGTVNIPLMVGSGLLEIIGDVSVPANCSFSSSGTCFQAADYAKASVVGFKVSGSIGMRGVRGGGLFFASIDFGSCSSSHIEASNGGWIRSTGNYTVSGASPRHIFSFTLSRVLIPGGIITFSSTFTYSDAFVRSSLGSSVQVQGAVFYGSAIGSRYRVESNAVIDTFGAGPNYLPGNAAGTNDGTGAYT